MILTVEELIALRQAITCRMDQLYEADTREGSESRKEQDRQITVLGMALVKFDDELKDEQYEISRLPIS